MSEYVDPEELPFTVAELFEAGRRVWPEERVVELRARLGPSYVRGLRLESIESLRDARCIAT